MPRQECSMMHRSSKKKAQVLIWMVVVVMATGMAAAPVRNAVTPIIARSFGPWIGHAPAVSSVQFVGTSAAVLPDRDITLDGPIGVPAAISYTGTGTSGHSAADHLARAESDAEAACSTRGGS